MKRVNLLDYFELAEAVAASRKTLSEPATAINVFFLLNDLNGRLEAFVTDDNGFSACKNVAQDIVAEITKWVNSNMKDDAGEFDSNKFNVELQTWSYSIIASKVTAFKSVFEAECRNVDVYSVGEVSIYKTSALVSNGAHFLPKDIREKLTQDVLAEFNSAGRCLAFSLPTACGFHALRGLELVLDAYLKRFGITKRLVSWNDYIKEAQRLIDDPKATLKPSAKVATMLDRMRELDRNPLMHPRNVLDDVSADMLYRLAAITVVEIVKDMPIKPTDNNLAKIAAATPPALLAPAKEGVDL